MHADGTLPTPASGHMRSPTFLPCLVVDRGVYVDEAERASRPDLIHVKEKHLVAELEQMLDVEESVRV
jgi:hypothetical protein